MLPPLALPGTVDSGPLPDRLTGMVGGKELGGSPLSRRTSRFGAVLDHDIYATDDGDQQEVPLLEWGRHRLHAVGPTEVEESIDEDLKRIEAARDQCLRVQVDVLECTLGVAFRDHRYRVEEILLKHLDAICYQEAKHDQEMAKVRAENQQLRTRCGLHGPPELVQTVLLESSGKKANASVKRAAAERARRGICDGTSPKPVKQKVHLESEDDDKDTMLHKHKSNKDRGGGCWQQFVAWVPNGAGLQAPQPWEPIPEHLLGTPTTYKSQSGKGPDSLREKRHPSVPGEVADFEDGEDDAEEHGRKRKLKVLEVWIQKDDEVSSESSIRSSQSAWAKKKGANKPLPPGTGANAETIEEELEQEQQGDWWVIHPHSKKRLIWDVSGLVLVVYDMITIPMALFPLFQSIFLTIMDWVTRLFWTADMGMSCCTGIIMADGSVTFQFRFVLKRYLKTWFAMDVFIVGMDWLEVIIQQAGSSLGLISRLTRVFRAVRVVRLLRLVRMKEVMQQITERIQSDALTFVINVTKLAILVLASSHVSGCIWWGIGSRPADEVQSTWVAKYGYDGADLEAQYLVCLHWAISQFVGGMDEITPVSSGERFYAVVLMASCSLIAAIVVSVLTSNLTQLHIIGGTRSRQLAIMRKFLKQNNISSNLALRMQRSAQHALSADLTADVVELLPVVSEPLRAEMSFELYAVVLKYHPFFAEGITECPQVVKRVCHFAISPLTVTVGDVVFSKGEVPQDPKMYFVCKGNLEYVQKPGTAEGLTEKQWIAEMVLWTRWNHKGTLTAANDVKLAMLSASAFQDIVNRFKDVSNFNPKKYAEQFVRYLNTLDHINDLTLFDKAREAHNREQNSGLGALGSRTRGQKVLTNELGNVLPSSRPPRS